MFSALKTVVYIQISPERLTLTNLKTGESIAEIPELAISAPPKRRILAAGSQARAAAASEPAEIVNPFAHPRSLVSDFTVAEQLIKHQLRRVLGNSILSMAPCVVIHPLGSPAGGFTQVERRAFREMAIGAGASEVFVWAGRPLTDQEALSRQPPISGGEWECRVGPNPSLEPTRTGMALGPRARSSYHRPRGPSTIPALARQLKR